MSKVIKYRDLFHNIVALFCLNEKDSAFYDLFQIICNKFPFFRFHSLYLFSIFNIYYDFSCFFNTNNFSKFRNKKPKRWPVFGRLKGIYTN